MVILVTREAIETENVVIPPGTVGAIVHGPSGYEVHFEARRCRDQSVFSESVLSSEPFIGKWRVVVIPGVDTKSAKLVPSADV